MTKIKLLTKSLLPLCLSGIAISVFAAGTPCIGLLAWNPNTTYATPGTEVQLSGTAYKSNYWNKGDSPDSNSGVGAPWTLLGACETPQTDTVSVSINDFPAGGLVFTDPAGITYPLKTSGGTVQLPYDSSSSTTYKVSASNFSGSVTPSSFSADRPKQALELSYTKFAQPKYQLVGYLDASDPGTAEAALGMGGSTTGYPTNLVKMKTAGYKTIVWGWLTVGTGIGKKSETVQFYNAQNAQIVDTVTPIARSNNMTVLISTGGSAQVFEKALIGPAGIGSTLTAADTNTLASNIVAFLQKNNIQGIDFDLETHTDPTFLNNLIVALKKDWPQIIITAAPQLNSNGTVAQLVTTANDTDYGKALANNDFTEVFVQDYCTPGYYLNDSGQLSTTPKSNFYSELDPQFIVPSYNAVKNYFSSLNPTTNGASTITTKIFLGEPASNSAASCAGNMYANHPKSDYPTLWTDLYDQYSSLIQEPNYGGAMVWSINGDFVNTPSFGFANTTSKAFD